MSDWYFSILDAIDRKNFFSGQDHEYLSRQSHSLTQQGIRVTGETQPLCQQNN